MRKNSLNVMLVDDHEVVLSGVTRLLSNKEDIKIIGTAKSKQDAIKIMENSTIDLAIIDLALPELEGIELHDKIKDCSPSTKTIVFSMHSSEWVLNRLLESGIDGYVSKASDFGDLMEAIDEVRAGNSYFCRNTRQLLSNHTLYRKSTDNGDLTRREREIIRLIFCELKTAQIAKKLSISKNTVESHRKNIMRKFQVKNSVGIIKKAIERGIINV